MRLGPMIAVGIPAACSTAASLTVIVWAHVQGVELGATRVRERLSALTSQRLTITLHEAAVMVFVSQSTTAGVAATKTNFKITVGEVQ